MMAPGLLLKQKLFTIKIFNGPSSGNINLNGWTLTANDGTPTIALNGTIPANSHFLLERTDDTTVPCAFMAYLPEKVAISPFYSFLSEKRLANMVIAD